MNRYILLILTICSGALLISCEQILNIDRENLFETGTVIEFNDRTATVVGEIISLENGGLITQHGHCWATHENPTVEDDTTDLGEATGTGEFESTLDNLQPDNQYFIRAYIITNGNVLYENEVGFSTRQSQSIITRAVFSIGQTSAGFKGEILDIENVTEHGFCWSTDTNAPEYEPGSPQCIELGRPGVTGSFTTNTDVTGLTPAQQYHVRAFLVKQGSVSYGNTITFNTLRP